MRTLILPIVVLCLSALQTKAETTMSADGVPYEKIVAHEAENKPMGTLFKSCFEAVQQKAALQATFETITLNSGSEFVRYVPPTQFKDLAKTWTSPKSTNVINSIADCAREADMEVSNMFKYTDKACVLSVPFFDIGFKSINEIPGEAVFVRTTAAGCSLTHILLTTDTATNFSYCAYVDEQRTIMALAEHVCQQKNAQIFYNQAVVDGMDFANMWKGFKEMGYKDNLLVSAYYGPPPGSTDDSWFFTAKVDDTYSKAVDAALMVPGLPTPTYNNGSTPLRDPYRYRTFLYANAEKDYLLDAALYDSIVAKPLCINKVVAAPSV